MEKVSEYGDSIISPPTGKTFMYILNVIYFNFSYEECEGIVMYNTPVDEALLQRILE